jgi:hypothetical protein
MTDAGGSALSVVGAGKFSPESGGYNPGAQPQTDPRILEQWWRRYEAALDRLQQAHIPIVRDRRRGFEVYRSLRSQWDAHIASLAPAPGYDRSQIDPAAAKPGQESERLPFAERRRAAG